MNIKEWLIKNKIKFNINHHLIENINYDIIELEIGNFLLLKEKNDIIFDNNFHFILNKEEENIINNSLIIGVIYNLGGKFYYDKIENLNSPKLNILKYIGNCEQVLDLDFIPLSIHGKYEILNGSRDYEDWCKKTIFYGYKSLGICEKNTLAGTLQFQIECEKFGLKSILGETISIKRKDFIFEGKVFCINEKGWENLLLINKEINVINVKEKYILEEILLQLSEGLIFIFNSTKDLNYYIYEIYNKKFEKLYFQIDSIIWKNNKKDKEYLLELKDYFDKIYKFIDPILINDSYYLDEEDYYIKEFLNKLGNFGFSSSSQNQFYKNLDDNYEVLNSLFKEEEFFKEIFIKSIENTIKLGDLINFKIQTKIFHLPKFSLDNLPIEYKKYENNEDLFLYLIEKGLEEKGKDLNGKEFGEWLNRLKEEIEIIKLGGFIDYFLILWDIIRWCKEQNILTGVGRGSSGGSLVSYLLDITKINPLEFNLLFERFLSKNRIKSSFPDIDIDFEGERRDEVKRYMEEKYGREYVCSIGTYTTLQIKQAIKDLSKKKGIEFSKVNYLTNSLNLRTGEWKDIFENALKKSIVYNFIQTYPDIINDIILCLNQPKASSIHPCATVILPKKENKNIFNTLPVRSEEGILVSEWEGEDIANAGYLKEDILGIRQLDKFKFILNLIKQTTGEEIDIYNIDKKNKRVFELFQQGYNSDVFHFGSELLTAYSKEAKPENLEDLIAMISLVRPGATQSGAHHDYVNLKNKIKQPIYDYNLKEVTKNTFGLYVYQEQIMLAVQVLGGFEPAESNDVLKAMGKLRRDILEPYEKKFIEGAIKNGCKNEEAKKIWNKLVGFADYGFNKAHATAYSIMGYICQWFKVYYPIQFWATALEFEKDENKINRYISEIKKIDDYIKIVPPDINKSNKKFYIDFKNGKIYWSLLSIYCVGEVAINEIIKQRELKGEYFSLKDFLSRVDKSYVDKSIVENLILSGAFDEICEIKDINERIKILENFYEIRNIKEKDKNNWYKEFILSKKYNKFKILLKQKELSNLGEFDFRDLIKNSNLKNLLPIYCNEIDFFRVEYENKKVIIGGIILDIKERSSKKGNFGQIEIDNNYEKILINYWNKNWEKDKKDFKENQIGKILIISGRIVFNNFSNSNQLQIEDDVEYMIIE